MTDSEINVVWCSADPGLPTGYGKVTFELLSRIFTESDPSAETGRQIIDNKNLYITHYSLYSVPENEGGQKRYRQLSFPNLSFENRCSLKDESGIEGFADYIKKVRPDVIFIYNGIIECIKLLKSCQNLPKKTKVVVYLDVYYEHMYRPYTQIYNDIVHSTVVFTEYQRDMLTRAGVKTPISILPHGINTNMTTRVGSRLQAKSMIQFPSTSFLVTVANKNQPRKRYDVLIEAWAKFCHKWIEQYGTQFDEMQTKMKTLQEDGKVLTMDLEDIQEYIYDGEFKYRMPVLMLICEKVSHSGWDLEELAYMFFSKEFIGSKKLEVTTADPKIINAIINRHIIFQDTSKGKLDDSQINIIYNATDLGICTSDGEGVGLCHLEQAYLGVPQIIGDFGGLPHVLPTQNTLKEVSDYTQKLKNPPTITGILGLPARTTIVNTFRGENAMSQIYILDASMVAKSIEAMYNNDDYRNQGSTYLTKHYITNSNDVDWDIHAGKLEECFYQVFNPHFGAVSSTAIKNNKLVSINEDIDDIIDDNIV